MVYKLGMRTKHITTKTTPLALQMLRLIAEHTGEKQYRVLERVLRQELVKLQQPVQPTKEEGYA
jgi:hypothetical protein